MVSLGRDGRVCGPQLLDCGIWICVGLLFVMFYPGGMSIDSFEHLLQARAGVLGDWHSPFMAWLWRGVDAVLRGPLLMMVAQFGVFLLASRMFAQAALPGSGTWFMLATLCVPPIAGILGVVWKDIWDSSLLLLAGAWLLDFEMRTAPVRVGQLLCGGLALLGALLFRHNAVFAMLPLAAVAAWQWRAADRRWRRLATSAGVTAAVVAGLVVAASGINRSLIDYHQFPQQSLFIFDLAGVAVHSGRADLLDASAGQLPKVLRGRDSISLDALRAHYHPSTWTPLALEAGSPLAMTDSATEVDVLAADWLRALREQPMAYLRHRAAVFRQVIGAHREPLFAPVYFAIPESSPDHTMVSRNFHIDADVSPLQLRLRSAFATLATWKLYRPWLWLGLNLCVVAAAIGARRPAVAAIALSGLGYELALFFIAPSADYRYSHWLILATWAAAVALVAQLLPQRSRRADLLPRAAALEIPSGGKPQN